MNTIINLKIKFFLNIFSGILTIVILSSFIENIIISNANAKGPGASNITYMQILQNPNDLDLNLNMHNSKVK